jgi:DNA-binding transcriptional LysR family regulator
VVIRKFIFHLSELETFLVVAEEGSFSKAASRLAISQPSASSRVKRLESLLSVRLLKRTTRSVELTEDGRLLRSAAEDALEGLHGILQQFHDRSQANRNRVVVTATPMIAATFMARIIQSYTERFPDVQVQLLDLPYDKLLRTLNEGDADIAVTAVDGDQDSLLFRHLAQEHLVLMFPAKHPLAKLSTVGLADILPYRVRLLTRYSSLMDTLAAEFAKLGAVFEASTASTLPTLLGLIDAGNCITFLPLSVARSNKRADRAISAIDGFQSVRRYGTLIARKATPSAAVQSFREHLHSEFGPLATRLSDP